MKSEDLYQKGLELLKLDSNSKEAFSCLIKAANMDHVSAQAIVGELYMEGRGVPTDTDKGIAWMEKAANQGCSIAERDLAISYQLGYGLPADIKKAICLYQRASDHGDIYAQHRLGVLYYKGNGIEKNPQKARSLFLQAAEHGSIDALLEIIHDEDRKDYTGKERCFTTIREEFRAGFGFVKEHINIGDTIVEDGWINDIRSYSRSEKHVHANRTCLRLIFAKDVLTAIIVNLWIEVLTAAGDIESAIEIGKYALACYKFQHKEVNDWFSIQSTIDTLSTNSNS